MYVQVCTCPNITYIVGVLGRYLSNPRMSHSKATKRVMRYSKRTRDYMLTYRTSDQLEIIGYFDSDFPRCQDSLRSTSGYIFVLVSGMVSWRSAKQSLTVSSTMAAKFVTSLLDITYLKIKKIRKEYQTSNLLLFPTRKKISKIIPTVKID